MRPGVGERDLNRCSREFGRGACYDTVGMSPDLSPAGGRRQSTRGQKEKIRRKPRPTSAVFVSSE
jgi:hypothetical protein